MRRFKVMIEGRNVVMRFDGRVARMAFFATRLIESDERDAAEVAALTLIEAEVMGIMLNARTDPPVFAVEDAVEIRANEQVNSTLSGFTWYPE